MNTKNNEERLEHWKTILESCQSRPDGQTIASWCEQNGISRDQYLYWRRRVQKKASLSVPAVEKDFEPITFFEISQSRKDSVPKSQGLADFRPDAIIQAGSHYLQNCLLN